MRVWINRRRMKYFKRIEESRRGRTNLPTSRVSLGGETYLDILIKIFWHWCKSWDSHKKTNQSWDHVATFGWLMHPDWNCSRYTHCTRTFSGFSVCVPWPLKCKGQRFWRRAYYLLVQQKSHKMHAGENVCDYKKHSSSVHIHIHETSMY